MKINVIGRLAVGKIPRKCLTSIDIHFSKPLGANNNMVAKKRKSKRQTLQQKFKIQKRTKEHHKRLNSGKLAGSFKSKKVDNFIPNAWPYKEDLLKEIKSAKEKMEAIKQRQKDKRQDEIVSSS